MALTFLRQDTDILSSDAYDDNITPSLAAFETNPVQLEEDLNNIRSQLSNLIDVQASDWYAIINTPATLEAGTQRGVNDLNTALHAIEKKRVLRDVHNLTDVTVGASDNFVILGTGELPAQTTAAVGTVTTLGTVVASHGGTFGTHALTEVAGNSALNPQNLVVVVDGASRDPILSGGRQVYGLLQGESGVTDGATITDTTTTRVQISFVRVNAAGDDLEAVPAVDIQGQTINYCTRERVRLEDLNEQDFLKGAIIDVGAGAGTIDRQTAYTNQGVTPVDVVTNSFLDLEGPGLEWTIRDDLEAVLLRILEGSAGGTSEIQFGADVDVFNNDAIDNDFANGATIGSAATGIQIAETAGTIERADNLTVFASGAGELFLHDSNIAGEGTWTQAGVKLTEDAGEVTAYETAFGGEVSLFNAIVQANNAAARARADAEVTVDIPADTLIEGPGGPGTANINVDLLDYSTVSFVSDVEVFINGRLMRNGANAAANEDVYPSAVTAEQQVGAFFAERQLKTHATNPDRRDKISMFRNGS